jgi:hypothetical protein
MTLTLTPTFAGILKMQKDRSLESKKKLESLQIESLREEKKVKELEDHEKKQQEVFKAKREHDEAELRTSLGVKAHKAGTFGNQIDAVYGARFRQGFALEGAIEFHAFAPLEALPCV